MKGYPSRKIQLLGICFVVLMLIPSLRADPSATPTLSTSEDNNISTQASTSTIHRNLRCLRQLSFFQFIRDVWQAKQSFFGFDCGDDLPMPIPTESPTTSAPTPKPTLAPVAAPGTSGDPLSEGSETQAPSAFTIDLELDLQGVGNRTVFDAAVAKWGKIITGDLPDFSGTLGGTSECGAWPNYVDDVFICGKYKNIDGPGNILGSAGPRAYRPASGLPITGNMFFDAADIQTGTIRDLFGVILHEMGHVLGIGSLWVQNGLTNSYTRPCPYKEDSAASREYRALSGCSGAIPVEMDTGRQGSDCGHFSERCFRSEIMTSAAGSTLPFSRLTIAGLEDLGYEVNYEVADPYSAADMSSECRCNNAVRHRANLEDGVFNIGSHGHGRRLSDEGRRVAMEYGKEILARNREQLPLIPSKDAIDVGGEIVFIMYMEEGVIYSVMVTAEDL